MRVSSHEVKQIFKQPIEEKMTREDVANWANERIILNDDGNLEYVPNQDVKKIWASLVYFSGVDLKESPNKYLHIKEDFVNVFKKIWD